MKKYAVHSCRRLTASVADKLSAELRMMVFDYLTAEPHTISGTHSHLPVYKDYRKPGVNPERGITKRCEVLRLMNSKHNFQNNYVNGYVLCQIRSEIFEAYFRINEFRIDSCNLHA
jgi:hypothetical protein